MNILDDIENNLDEAFEPYKLTVGEIKKMLANVDDDFTISFTHGNEELNPYEQWTNDEANTFNMSFR